ncbi:hypothetical protein PO909_013435 [Leuciscus waleckii]
MEDNMETTIKRSEDILKTELTAMRTEFASHMTTVQNMCSKVDFLTGERREQKRVVNEQTWRLDALEQQVTDLQDRSNFRLSNCNPKSYTSFLSTLALLLLLARPIIGQRSEQGRDQLTRVRVETETREGRVRVETETKESRVRVETETRESRVRVESRPRPERLDNLRLGLKTRPKDIFKNMSNIWW